MLKPKPIFNLLQYVEDELRELSNIPFCSKDIWFSIPFYDGFRDTVIYRKYVTLPGHSSEKYPTMFLQAIFDNNLNAILSYDIIERKIDMLSPTIQTSHVLFGFSSAQISNIIVKSELSNGLIKNNSQKLLNKI